MQGLENPAEDVATEMLKRHEGYRALAYIDTRNNLTVGYGRNLSTTGLSQAEAECLLRRDVNRASEFLSSYPFWQSLSNARRAVRIDMCFNVGERCFSEFVKMIEALYLEDYVQASHEMLLSRAANECPERYRELAAGMAKGELPG